MSKKQLFFYFLCTLNLILFCTLIKPTSVLAVANDEKVLKMEVTIPQEYVTENSGKVLSARKSLYGWTDNKFVFQPGDKLVYEVFSPTPVAGLGLVDGQFQTTWKDLSTHFIERDLKDTAGDSMKPETNLASKISNGWHRREFVLDEILTNPNLTGPFLCHFVLGIKITAPVNYSAVVVYYRNIHIERANGSKVYILFNENLNLIYENYPAYDDTVNLGSNMSFSTLDELTIPVITADSFPSFAFQNTEVDLSNVTVSNDGALNITVYDAEGNNVPVEDNKFIPTTTGKFTVLLQGSLNGITTKITKEIEIAPMSQPNILQEDLDLITAIGSAGVPYSLPKIKAIYNGEKTLDTTVTVFDSENNPIAVTDEGDMWSFIPTPKRSDIYRVVYTATVIVNETEVSDSKHVYVVVEDHDKPVINTSGLPTSIDTGIIFTIPEVTANDQSDGVVEVTYEVIDPYGDPVNLDNRQFFVNIAGEYTLRFSATDSDNNTTVKEVKLIGVNQTGQVVHLRVFIPEELRGEGVRKAVRVSLGYVEDNFQLDLHAGDKLFYSFYSPHKIAGIGGFEGQFRNSWAHFSQRGFHDLTDQNGLSMNPTTDLSDKFQNGWYYREISITQAMADDATIAHYVLVINTADAVGEYIDVYYKNIGIIRTNGNIEYLFDGTNAVRPEYFGVDNNDPQGIYKSLTYKMFAEFDPVPSVNLNNLPGFIGINELYVIPKNIFTDYQDYKGLTSIAYHILDPNNQEVTVTNGSFTPTIIGVYTITATGIDSDNNVVTVTFMLEARDIVLDNYKVTKKESLNTYVNLEEYSELNQTLISQLINNGKAQIDAAESIETIDLIYNNIINQIDKITAQERITYIDITLTSVFFGGDTITHNINKLHYGSKIDLSINLPSIEGYEFAYWVVNGAVRRDLPINYEFTIITQMDIIAVFTEVNKYAVLFIDSNGKLLDTQFVAPNTLATQPDITLPTKIGYVVKAGNSRWLSTDNKGINSPITNNTVFILQYELDTEETFIVTLEDAYILDGINKVTEFEYPFNYIATIYAEDKEGKRFSHFEENGVILSKEKIYRFTVIEDRNIKAVYVEDSEEVDNTPMVYMSKAYELRTGYKTYISQFYISEGYELIEYGIITSMNEGELTLTTVGANIYQGRKYTTLTNEYVFSIATSSHVKAKAYIIVRNIVTNELEYIYSE